MRFRCLFAACVLIAAAEAGMAQNWPTKSVTMVVPWPPGGPRISLRARSRKG